MDIDGKLKQIAEEEAEKKRQEKLNGVLNRARRDLATKGSTPAAAEADAQIEELRSRQNQPIMGPVNSYVIKDGKSGPKFGKEQD